MCTTFLFCLGCCQSPAFLLSLCKPHGPQLVSCKLSLPLPHLSKPPLSGVTRTSTIFSSYTAVRLTIGKVHLFLGCCRHLAPVMLQKDVIKQLRGSSWIVKMCDILQCCSTYSKIFSRRSEYHFSWKLAADLLIAPYLSVFAFLPA